MPSSRLPSIVTEFVIRFCNSRPRLCCCCCCCRPALCDSGTSPVGAKAEMVFLISPVALSPPGHGGKDIPLSRQQANRLFPVVFLLLPVLVGDRGSFCARERQRADCRRSRSYCFRYGGRQVSGSMPVGARFCPGASSPNTSKAATDTASLCSRAASATKLRMACRRWCGTRGFSCACGGHGNGRWSGSALFGSGGGSVIDGGSWGGGRAHRHFAAVGGCEGERCGLWSNPTDRFAEHSRVWNRSAYFLVGSRKVVMNISWRVGLVGYCRMARRTKLVGIFVVPLSIATAIFHRVTHEEKCVRRHAKGDDPTKEAKSMMPALLCLTKPRRKPHAPASRPRWP